jgi:hypothetical protein
MNYDEEIMSLKTENKLLRHYMEQRFKRYDEELSILRAAMPKRKPKLPWVETMPDNICRVKVQMWDNSDGGRGVTPYKLKVYVWDRHEADDPDHERYCNGYYQPFWFPLTHAPAFRLLGSHTLMEQYAADIQAAPDGGDFHLGYLTWKGIKKTRGTTQLPCHGAIKTCDNQIVLIVRSRVFEFDRGAPIDPTENGPVRAWVWPAPQSG